MKDQTSAMYAIRRLIELKGGSISAAAREIACSPEMIGEGVRSNRIASVAVLAAECILRRQGPTETQATVLVVSNLRADPFLELARPFCVRVLHECGSCLVVRVPWRNVIFGPGGGEASRRMRGEDGGIMILIFDTETTGLADSALPPEHPAQPKLVQLGAILVTDAFEEVASVDLTVRPDGYQIPDAAARCHGITTAIAQEVGVPLANVLGIFAQLRANAVECVAFNLRFDRLVMEAAYARLGRQPSRGWPDRMTCCMEDATPIMELPPTARMKAYGFDTKYKPPNLAEAHRFFTGEDFANAHSAIHDARAALRVHRVLRMMEAP